MSKFETFAKKIDRLSDWVGKLVGYLIIPLILIVVFEVVMRYFFSAPTIWGWDVNMYLGGLMIIFGGAYALLHDSHVSVEFMLENWTPRKRALLNIILSPLIILPLAIMVWYGAEAAWHSIKINEKYTSLWEPIIYPLRISIPVGGALFFLQAIAKLIRDIALYQARKRPRHTQA